MSFSKKGYRASMKQSVKNYLKFKDYYNDLDYYQEIAYLIFLKHRERVDILDALAEIENYDIPKDKLKVLIVESLLDELYANNKKED